MVFNVSKLDDSAWAGIMETIEREHLEEKIFLDPKFWKALGKAEGWGGIGVEGFMLKKSFEPNWQKNMHSFIDHLIEGKDINTFFKELLRQDSE